METLRMRNYYPEKERGGQFQADDLDKFKGTTNNSV